LPRGLDETRGLDEPRPARGEPRGLDEPRERAPWLVSTDFAEPPGRIRIL